LPEDEQSCPECGSKLHIMGKEIRRELKLIPAKAVIVEHIDYVYACRDCEKDACGVPIVKAPMDQPVIKGSFGFSGSRCADHDAKVRQWNAAISSGAGIQPDGDRSIETNDVELAGKVR
jgi:hypothetical protein